MNKTGWIWDALGTSLLLGIFLFTGLDKLFHYEIFEVQLHQSAFLAPYSWIISRTLPILECTASLLLLHPKSKPVGLFIILFLLSGFTTYIYLVLHSTQSIPCSCGGFVAALSWKQHLVFNSIVIGVTIILIIYQGHHAWSNKFSREESGDTENLQKRVSNHQNSFL